ncbi:MAG: trehalose-6-phosphate synthase [Bdellovibrionales bacterium]|nr:trehalose-6-phosphate synthase [Bdellovibrionales bacterium]
MNDQTPRNLVIFSNREPYIHAHTRHGIEVQRPASGLVSALEPVMRKLGGLWIAHGSGSADAETCDTSGVIAVPPEDPLYRLKRVWLSPTEQRQYYDGFSNEALWPLFHLAHHQPIFRRTDWDTYTRVNERFANSLSDAELSAASSILVQDFHLALVPQFLRSRISQAQLSSRIALTWHIPWIPSEIYKICPWAKDLLAGMLGADLITFHTASYGINFLESCERLLECRIDRERQTVTFKGRDTKVKATPIGIDPPPLANKNQSTLKGAIFRKFGVSAEILALGVDRLDYTKGIPQRLLAIEEFLDKNPQFLGKFCFIQIASPTRTEVTAYRNFSLRVQSETQRINQKFKTQLSMETSELKVHPLLYCPPIRLVLENQTWESLGELYRAADLCIVSSLHDGMNLVAKEYVWAKGNLNGALLLSKFAGASHELPEAFLFNPYDQEESARLIYTALTASQSELRERMKKMNHRVTARDARAWAEDILSSMTA